MLKNSNRFLHKNPKTNNGKIAKTREIGKQLQTINIAQIQSSSDKEDCKQNKMILAKTLSIINDQIYLRHSLKKSMEMEQTFHAKINDLKQKNKGN